MPTEFLAVVTACAACMGSKSANKDVRYNNVYEQSDCQTDDANESAKCNCKKDESDKELSEYVYLRYFNNSKWFEKKGAVKLATQ